MCTVGPPPPSPFNTPAGPVNLRVVNIQEGADRTDQSAPGADDVNPLAGAPATGSGNSANGTCTLPGPGVYEVDAQTQFLDIPTSATPGPRD